MKTTKKKVWLVVDPLSAMPAVIIQYRIGPILFAQKHIYRETDGTVHACWLSETFIER